MTPTPFSQPPKKFTFIQFDGSAEYSTFIFLRFSLTDLKCLLSLFLPFPFHEHCLKSDPKVLGFRHGQSSTHPLSFLLPT
ncbi:hypothetical protein L2E82_38200 [Cichorium intybus]|uniref:Uncharacterized protein n=1 Tax=Cichorium intybus TaxID=13427 RepID=A0ACB9AFM9_CICIN|nr:hypothetical protein L2E82_38200 [Cichorium intybus]